MREITKEESTQVNGGISSAMMLSIKNSLTNKLPAGSNGGRNGGPNRAAGSAIGQLGTGGGGFTSPLAAAMKRILAK